MSDRETEQAVVRAIPPIVEALGPEGVAGVQWFLAFKGEPIIWLVTGTGPRGLPTISLLARV